MLRLLAAVLLASLVADTAFASCPADTTYVVPPSLNDGGAPLQDDGPQIRRVIEQAISDLDAGLAGAATVRLNREDTYFVFSRPNRHDVMDIRGQYQYPLACLTIDGNEATVKVDNLAVPFYFSYCDACGLRNIKLDTIQTTNKSGLVVEKDIENCHFDAAIPSDQGDLPDLPEGFADRNNASSLGQMLRGHRVDAITFYGFEKGVLPNHFWHRSIRPNSYARTEKVSVQDASRRLVRVYLQTEMVDGARVCTAKNTEILKNIAIDATIFTIPYAYDPTNARFRELEEAWNTRKSLSNTYFWMTRPYLVGRSSPVTVENSENFAIDHVTISDFPGTAALFSVANDGTTINGLSVVPKTSGTVHHIHAISSAAIRSWNDRNGPTITNSLFRAVGDDAVNISALAFRIHAIPDGDAPAREAIFRSDSRFFLQPRVGDQFAVVSLEGTVLKRLVVAECGDTRTLPGQPCQQTGFNKYRIKFNSDLPGQSLDDDGDDLDEPDTRFINLSTVNNNASITDNAVISTLRKPFLLQSGAELRRNLVVNSGGPAVAVGHVSRADVWGDTLPVRIEDNTFIETDGGVVMGISTNHHSVTAHQPTVIRGNRFMDLRSRLLYKHRPTLTMPVSTRRNSLYQPDTGPAQRVDQLIAHSAWDGTGFSYAEFGDADLSALKTHAGMALESCDDISAYYVNEDGDAVLNC